MAIRQGRCTNFGNCTVADTKQLVSVADGNDMVCPECGKQLTEIESRKPASMAPVFIVIAVLLLLGVGAAFFIKSRMGSSKAAQSTPAAGPVNTPTPAGKPGQPALRLHGSNTIGGELAPALAQAFLQQQGAQNIKREPDGPDQVRVSGVVPGESNPEVIEIHAHGSSTAFTDLEAGNADIGMASRRIKPDEVSKLAGLGDMTSSACEHVVGLDGIAVIVNKANPVAALSKEQLAKIFSGEITNWSQAGGQAGEIKLFARDDKSGTYDTFKTLVMPNSQLAQGAVRIEDSRILSDRVAYDSNAIGFVGLPYVHSAKAIAISEKGSRALMPSPLTVATEDYPLSRRLYLYTAAAPKNPLVNRFIEFALGKSGQDVVGANKFISQNVEAVKVAAPPPTAPTEYAKLTQGAQRLSLDFRFKTGSSELDNKAVADLDRVVSFLSDLHYTGDRLMLLGFADSTGSAAKNLQLSKDRAKTIADQFGPRGVTPSVVTGFGAEDPVASNDNEEGRQKNRRVEIWVKGS